MSDTANRLRALARASLFQNEHDAFLRAAAEIDRLRAVEVDLRAVIEKAAEAWLEIEGVPWEGDLGDAVATGVREIKRLRAACTTLGATLSRIDYALGPPNEQGVSLYDVDHDEERVVRSVVAAREREGKLREAARPHTACLGKQPAGVGPQTFGIWRCQECAGCRLAAILAEGDGEEKP